MIYTMFGVPVRIAAISRFASPMMVDVVQIGDQSWKRQRLVSELKADGGSEEINHAIEAVRSIPTCYDGHHNNPL